jgi:ankyrin repeat protein
MYTIDIFKAVYNNDLEAVKTYINNGDSVNIRDKDRNTPLLEACTWGNTEIAQLLIDRGARINVKNIGLFSPLTTAIYFNDIKLVMLLIKKGANVNARNDTKKFKPGFSALKCAIFNNRTEIIELLQNHGAVI